MERLGQLAGVVHHHFLGQNILLQLLQNPHGNAALFCQALYALTLPLPNPPYVGEKFDFVFLNAHINFPSDCFKIFGNIRKYHHT